MKIAKGTAKFGSELLWDRLEGIYNRTAFTLFKCDSLNILFSDVNVKKHWFFGYYRVLAEINLILAMRVYQYKILHFTNFTPITILLRGGVV